MHEFNQSLKYDKRMYAADIKGSIAFSKALLKAGILDKHEQEEITRGLKEVEGEWQRNEVCSLSYDGSALKSGCSSRYSRTTRTFILPMRED